MLTPQFICGIFLLLVAIGDARGASTKGKSSKTQNVSIKQLTKPAESTGSPLWDKRSEKLYYTDPFKQRIYLLDPATGSSTYAQIGHGHIGVVVPVKGKSNQFVVGAGKDFLLVTWDTNENCPKPIIEVLGSVEANKSGTRFSGGSVDSKGRLWAGTMGPLKRVTPCNPTGIAPNQGSVYRLTGDRVIEKEISPVTITNGMAWNKAGTTFYFIDTPTLKVAAYDYDAEHGKISNRRIAFDFSRHNLSGRPGDITVDSNDHLWITTYRGGSVIEVDPVKGKVLQTIEIPAAIVGGLTWGGDSFGTLYVTTSRRGLKPAEIKAAPKSGSVFAITGLGARGSASHPFSLKTKST